MYHEGEYVVCWSDGVCMVDQVTTLDWTENKKRLYYVLVPQKNPGAKLYSPVDNTKVQLRKIVSEEEAWKLIDSIPETEPLSIANEKMREECFQHAIRTCDCQQWVRVMKTVYQNKNTRAAAGKKLTAIDDRYHRMAKDYLYSELAAAIGEPESQIEDVITKRLEKKATEV